MSRIQDLEIEVRRLQDEVASLKRRFTKIYRISSEVLVQDTRPVRGRPVRYDETTFIRALRKEYQAAPEHQRSRDDLAARLHISRRTFSRYCERWSVLWPPVATTEEVLESLKAADAAQEAPHGASSEPARSRHQLEEGWLPGARR